jgi:hypothetical protein
MRRRHNQYEARYYGYDWFDERYRYPTPVKPYSFLGFLGDLFMTIITSGLWLIWIFVREMRRR